MLGSENVTAFPSFPRKKRGLRSFPASCQAYMIYSPLLGTWLLRRRRFETTFSALFWPSSRIAFPLPSLCFPRGARAAFCARCCSFCSQRVRCPIRRSSIIHAALFFVLFDAVNRGECAARTLLSAMRANVMSLHSVGMKAVNASALRRVRSRHIERVSLLSDCVRLPGNRNRARRGRKQIFF